jgi:hypothetical protein
MTVGVEIINRMLVDKGRDFEDRKKLHQLRGYLQDIESELIERIAERDRWADAYAECNGELRAMTKAYGLDQEQVIETGEGHTPDQSIELLERFIEDAEDRYGAYSTDLIRQGRIAIAHYWEEQGDMSKGAGWAPAWMRRS